MELRTICIPRRPKNTLLIPGQIVSGSIYPRQFRLTLEHDPVKSSPDRPEEHAGGVSHPPSIVINGCAMMFLKHKTSSRPSWFRTPIK